MHYDIVRLSSKGQLVVPRDVRRRFGLRPGTKLALFIDGTNILLQPIPLPDISAFNRMAVAAKKVMEQVKAGRTG